MKIINGRDAHLYENDLTKAYQLRHQVFVEEKGWEDIRKADGIEKDQFDTDDAIHMLLYEEKELIGYQRMLPTTAPYLLSDVYPQLCESELPNDQAIWEWTRFAVDKKHRGGGRKLSRAGNLLLSAIVEWGLERGIHSIVIEMNPLWLLRLVQLHFKVTPLGIAQQIGNEEVLAVLASFDARTLARLRELRGDERTAITATA